MQQLIVQQIMQVTQDFSNRGVSIEKLYSWYRDESFLVNRRYQRKLVWTIEEKEALIESISKKFPLPLIIVAEIVHNGKVVYEIIDGMQRLEAIFAFIENKLHFKGRYFDLETLGLTKSLKDNDILQQKIDIWDKEFCLMFTSYEVPLFSYKQDDEKIIDEIFKRINYYGKHLSEQELCQAGSETEYAGLVRTISEIVRGDVSHEDKLSLNNMSHISISNHSLHYGIKFNEIFWKKHNIVTSENIRISRDEELVAHLLAGILLNPRPDATAKTLNKLYSVATEENLLIEEAIRKHGKDYIVRTFEIVFTEIKKTLQSCDVNFYDLLFKKVTTHVNRSYQIIFLAYYELLIKQEKIIINYQHLAEKLAGIGDTILTPIHENLNMEKERGKAINSIIGNISQCFRDRDVNDPALDNGVMKLESLLSRSKTENTNYDYKIGFHLLNDSGNFDENAFEKVMHTLVAMANISKNSIGYVVIGVADKEDDKNQFERLYHNIAKKFQGHWITGVQNEAQNYPKAHDGYLMAIKEKIRQSPITPIYYKDDILSNIDYFSYYDKEILILKIQGRGQEVAKYDGKVYQRQGTSTELVSADREAIIWKRILM